jgi:hypothetical protein
MLSGDSPNSTKHRAEVGGEGGESGQSDERFVREVRSGKEQGNKEERNNKYYTRGPVGTASLAA